MKIQKLVAFLMAALMLAACTPAMAESMFGGPLLSDKLDQRTAYEEMKKAVEDKDYETARYYLAQVAEDDYQQTRQYTLYLDGIQYMEQENFTYAAQVFGGLSLEATPFLDSKLLFNYCNGRVMEDAGKYDEAIAVYQLSLAYQDAAQRIQTCLGLAAKAREDEAQSLYQRGLAANDVALLKEAQTYFISVGNADMNEKCQSAIDRINKQAAYSSAMKQYQEAVAKNDPLALSAAATAFEALGSYENSAQMIREIESLIRTIQRTITLTSTKTAVDSITITWLDSAAGSEQYTVAWKPVGNRSEQRVTTGEQQIVLEGLIPNTEYSICISVAGNEALTLELAASTTRESAQAVKGFSVRSSYVVGMNRRRYVSPATLREYLETNSKPLTFPVDNVIPLEDIDASLQEMIYGYVVSFEHKDELAGPITVQWILRTKNSGVYAGEVMEASTLPKAGYTICMLDELLDQMYLDQGSWPEETCMLEMYINGGLCTRVIFSIGK